jgi:hypothetical protein
MTPIVVLEESFENGLFALLLVLTDLKTFDDSSSFDGWMNGWLVD